MEQEHSQNMSELQNTQVESGAPKKHTWIVFVVIAVLIIGLGVYASLSAGLFRDSDSNSDSNASTQCDMEYQDLLDSSSFDTTECAQFAIRSGEFDGEPPAPVQKNIVLIFDSSGSMIQKVGSRTKMDIAKEAVERFITELDTNNTKLSIVVYGHKGSNSVADKALSCSSIEELYRLDEVKSDIALSLVSGLQPTGWTPIAGSLQQATSILTTKTSPDDRDLILLVSDGEERCDGDPVTTVREVKASNPNMLVNVIGFGVGGATEDQLRAIAVAGDGQYFSAKNLEDLEESLLQQQYLLEQANFKLQRGTENLYDISNIIAKYNYCTTMLDLEEGAIMLNTHVDDSHVSKQCKSYVEETYSKRYSSIQNELERVFQSEKDSFNDIINSESR